MRARRQVHTACSHTVFTPSRPQVRKHERLHAVDVNGRTYCGCGASFCMKLERRSIREPRRTVRNMVEAFRGANINAI